MLINGKRELAYISKILNVSPINGADNIELVKINGWNCISKKNEFHVGDYCVYFEIDSKLDSKRNWTSFLEKKHYAVKTMKLSKFNVISQGLALPLSDIPDFSYKDSKWIIKGKEVYENMPLTEALGVSYYVPEDNVRKSSTNISSKNSRWNKVVIRHPWIVKSKIGRRLSKYNWFKNLCVTFLSEKYIDTSFPTKFDYIGKTDEDRIENRTDLLKIKQLWTVTTKVDGCSATYILSNHDKDKNEFYVCSRNLRILSPNQDTFFRENVYWKIAEEYKIKDILQKLLNTGAFGDYICIQREIAGEAVQGNPHKLKGLHFYVFNLISPEHGRYNSFLAKSILSSYGLDFVPIVSRDFIMPDTIEEMKALADGECEVPGSTGLREGYVYRLNSNPFVSVKNVSNKYLLKKKE